MIRIGETDEGEVALDKSDLATHVHGLGRSQTGKTKLIEHIGMQLFVERRGFCLIDPHGKLYDTLLKRLAFIGSSRDKDVILFNPSDEDRITGFNPFYSEFKDEARLTTKTRRMVAATLKAWGAEHAKETPRLRKWLENLYYTLLEQDLPLTAADYFLSYKDFTGARDRIIAGIRSRRVKEQWTAIYKLPFRDFNQYLESMESRLLLLQHPHLQRLMSVRENAINFDEIINQQKVLLVNLQPSDYLEDETSKTIATLFVNEIWEIMRRRREEKPKDFFFILDEFQEFITPDIPKILDQAAKYGLHMFLFHQRGGHLTRQVEDAMSNASATIRFVAQQRFILQRGEDTPPIEVEAPFIKPVFIDPKYVEAYVAARTASFMTPEGADAALDMVKQRLEGHSSIPPIRDPVESEPVPEPLPAIKYGTNPAELLQEFRYLTVAHIQALAGKSQRMASRIMEPVVCDVLKLDRKYVYGEKGREHKNLAHEVGISDVHVKLYLSGNLATWRQSGLRQYEHPDAFFQTTEGRSFFLEYQRSHPNTPPIEVARQYDRMATVTKQYLDLCQNFHLLYVFHPDAEVDLDTLLTKLAGLENPCRFWVADPSLTMRCGKYHDHTIGVPSQNPIPA